MMTMMEILYYSTNSNNHENVHSNRGIFIKVKPWMEIINDDFFIIKPDKIMTMTEVKDERLIDI